MRKIKRESLVAGLPSCSLELQQYINLTLKEINILKCASMNVRPLFIYEIRTEKIVMLLNKQYIPSQIYFNLVI